MSSEFENLFVFAADSLRWDFLPDQIAQLGVDFKTVASSSFSAPSFASLSTGKYPQKHGVSGWNDQIGSSITSIFDISDMNTGYFQSDKGPDEDALYSVLRQNERKSILDLSPPFICLERDLTPHVPFGPSEQNDSTAEEYYNSVGGSWNKIREEYRSACQESAKKFLARLGELEDSGLLDSTLCIFTSDHGELLGEYGEAGHSSPNCPELTYVPSVFIHPDLSRNSFEVNPDSNVIEHVDLINTSLSLLDKSEMEFDGVNITKSERLRDWGYNHVILEKGGAKMYESSGIWWFDSGYSFHRNRKISRLSAAIYRLVRSPERRAVRKKPISVMQSYLTDNVVFGTPPQNQGEASQIIDDFEEKMDKVESGDSELSNSAKDRLEELGYIDT
ncbi:sulfatase-like hydrolase/transferase [Haloferax volcanii]|uniref:sulfatase-like hydrolase/transferase n=1 Tax=Haloferax volcanii TaxID=2246 RepID=UPI003852D3BA